MFRFKAALGQPEIPEEVQGEREDVAAVVVAQERLELAGADGVQQQPAAASSVAEAGDLAAVVAEGQEEAPVAGLVHPADGDDAGEEGVHSGEAAAGRAPQP